MAAFDSKPGRVVSISQCPVCCNEYHPKECVPRLLRSCGHTFCESCLTNLKKNSSVVRCPSCRMETTIEAGKGVTDSFPKNYALLENIENVKAAAAREAVALTTEMCEMCSERRQAQFGCIECETKYCEVCWGVYHKVRALRSHEKVGLGDIFEAKCPNHPSKTAELVCLEPSCPAYGGLICLLCEKMVAHKGHLTEPIEQVAADKRKQLQTVINDAQQNVDYALSVLVKVEEADELLNGAALAGKEKGIPSTGVQSNREKALVLIDRTFRQLMAALEQRRAALIDQVGALVKTKSEKLEDQRTELCTFLSRSYTRLQDANQALNRTNDKLFVASFRAHYDLLVETSHIELFPEPVVLPDVHVVFPKDLTPEISSAGILHDEPRSTAIQRQANVTPLVALSFAQNIMPEIERCSNLQSSASPPIRYRSIPSTAAAARSSKPIPDLQSPRSTTIQRQARATLAFPHDLMHEFCTTNLSSSTSAGTLHDQPVFIHISGPRTFVQAENGKSSGTWGSLIHLNSKFSGRIYELKAPVVKVGKSDQLSEIVIDNTFLSGLHATFSYVNNVPTIMDHSRHGTWVNEVRLLKDEPKKLSSHDEISFIIKSAAEAKRQIERGSKSAVDFHSFIFQMAKPSFTSSGFTSGSKTLHDDYQVLSELEQGSFAVVHLAVHRVTGQQVAVKVIDRIKMKHGTTKAEVDILMSLNHPGVIKILAIYETEQEMSIVMELVEGGDLFDRIDAKRRYPEEEARELFKQLCHCVNYLHSQGVAHRDLKPENILMVSPSDDISIKLTEFGVSKMIDEGIMMQTLCGTPQYVAPEIISKPTDVRSYTKAVDLWSMGVILFTLLAGFTPFGGSNFRKISAGKFDFTRAPWISLEARDLIRHMLVVDPAQRFTIAQCLDHLWTTPAPLSSRSNP